MKSSSVITLRHEIRLTSLVIVIAVLIVSSARLNADTGTCGGGSVTLPFTDVPAANVFFCSIASAFYSGLTNGTSDTTYTPGANVTRDQMAAFVSRTLEQSIRRNNLRALTRKWYLPSDEASIALTTVGDNPQSVEFDGTDLWVANLSGDTVQRLRSSDGQLLQTFTSAESVRRTVEARGRIFAIGITNPGRLYSLDPTAAAGPVTVELTNLPALPRGIAFDGGRLWTANSNGISIITFNPTQATNLTAGFSAPDDILFDGSNIWVTDSSQNKLLKLDANGAVIKQILVGSGPKRPVFDGLNIWVPNRNGDSVTVVRVKDSQGNPLTTPFVLATLTGNGLDNPEGIAFDGERILVTHNSGVSLFKAADLSPLGTISVVGGAPSGACSDGKNFWVALGNADKLARF